MYKQAHAKKKQQVKDLEAEIVQSKGQISEITGSDMQQTLIEKSLLQREKGALQAALSEKDQQASVQGQYTATKRSRRGRSAYIGRRGYTPRALVSLTCKWLGCVVGMRRSRH